MARSRNTLPQQIDVAHLISTGVLALLERLQPDQLLLADRSFYAFAPWHKAQASGAKLLWRVKSNLRLPVHKRLRDGSYTSEVFASGDRKRRQGQKVRVIEYTLAGVPGPAQTYRLITNLDPEEGTAQQLAALYHERWEIENTFGEFKTHLAGGYSSALRSKTPELVLQELWGLLLAHFAVRQLMAQAAWRQKQDPDRPSFVHAVRVLRRRLPQAAVVPPERLPVWRDALLTEIAAGTAVSSRGRINPRGVKRKMSHFNLRHRGARLHRKIAPVPVLIINSS